MTRVNPVIRPARQTDDGDIARIFVETRGADFEALPAAMRDSVLELQSRAQNAEFERTYPNAVHWVIEVDDEVVGRLVVDHAPGEVRIVDIAVRPEAQGRGAGTAAIDGVVRAARAATSVVSLSVWSDNAGATRLYERLGFVATAAGGGYTRMVAQ